MIAIVTSNDSDKGTSIAIILPAMIVIVLIAIKLPAMIAIVTSNKNVIYDSNSY